MKQKYWYRTYRGDEMYELTGWHPITAPALNDFLNMEARLDHNEWARLDAVMRHGVEEAKRNGGRNTFRTRLELGEGHSPILVGTLELKITTYGRSEEVHAD